MIAMPIMLLSIAAGTIITFQTNSIQESYDVEADTIQVITNPIQILNRLTRGIYNEIKLTALKEPCRVEMHVDSKYVMDGISRWIHGWKRNGWRTADKKPVKNEELWKRLDAALKQHKIEWKWVKGHAGDEMNERADALARAGMAPFKPGR